MPKQPTSNLPRLDAGLLKGLDPREAEAMAQLYNSSLPIRELLVSLLTKELESSILLSDSAEYLDSPNALAKVADQSGYRRGLKRAIKLLSNRD